MCFSDGIAHRRSWRILRLRLVGANIAPGGPGASGAIVFGFGA
jgi:hypothetical protein